MIPDAARQREAGLESTLRVIVEEQSSDASGLLPMRRPIVSFSADTALAPTARMPSATAVAALSFPIEKTPCVDGAYGSPESPANPTPYQKG